MEIVPYRGKNCCKIYKWFEATHALLRNDEEYQQKKVMNETTTNMMS